MDLKDQFDYAIIGCGVAGLHLTYQFSQHTFFNDKKIAVVDKTIVPKTDRVLSFWEKSNGVWDQVVANSWNAVIFKDETVNFEIDLKPFKYKSLHFKDFSSFCLNEIKNKSNFHFIDDKVVATEENKEFVTIKLTNTTISSKLIFDSRISSRYYQNSKKYPSVTQSFKGWVVEFEDPVFDSNTFTMMDYRKQWQGSNSFMYVLPSSNNKALLEYTFFAPFTISDKKLDLQIKEYIETFFPEKRYQILTVEAGEIPMTTYPFKDDSSPRALKIGTAGGWVKASTGYSFKFAERNAILIAKQIEKGKRITGYKQPNRFKFYDRLFIKVLQHQNKRGPYIFQQMYSKVKISTLFRFLDEETSIKEELGLISKLPYLPFLKQLF